MTATTVAGDLLARRWGLLTVGAAVLATGVAGLGVETRLRVVGSRRECAALEVLWRAQVQARLHRLCPDD